MPRKTPRQLLTWNLAFAVVAAGFASLASVGTAAARPAERHGRDAVVPATATPTVSLTAAATLSTSTGVRVGVVVNANNGTPSARKNTFDILLSRKVTSPVSSSETHAWTFVLSPTALQADQTSGTAKITTGMQLNPYGLVKLAFRKISSRTATCKLGSKVVDAGVLAGTLFFDTRSAAWGTLGSKTKPLTWEAEVSVTFDSNCVNPARTPVPSCIKGFVWSSPGAASPSGGMELFAGGAASIYSLINSHNSISANRSVMLSNPYGASRVDEAAEASSAPAYNTATKVLSIATPWVRHLSPVARSYRRGPPLVCRTKTASPRTS